MEGPQNVTTDQYTDRCRGMMAPCTGDVPHELALEAAEYFGITLEEAQRRIATSGDEFPAEWQGMVTDPADEDQLARFYNESKTELFEQIAWHSRETTHERSFVCVDLAVSRPGRAFLDYGSGIGSNALVFGLAGFDVTLADIAEPLLNFARWRCERRGLRVQTIDLKRKSLEPSAYDVVTCFDVLEHVSQPLNTLKQLSSGIRPGGVLFLHAPIGYDPVRPQHVAHDPSVLRRIRSLGFSYFPEWERQFPSSLATHSAYLRVGRSAAANFAYYLRDVFFPGNGGAMLARAWRALPRAPHPVE